VSSIKSAADFKPQQSIRPSAMDTAEEVSKGGKLQHTEIKEEDLYDWSIDTFGRMASITRQDIVNDNLNFFGEMPMLLAQAAARALLDLWFTVLLGGETAGHFSAGNGNLLGAGSNLSIDSIKDAVQTMREMRDSK